MSRVFTIAASGTTFRYPVTPYGTVSVDPDDPQENPRDRHFDPFLPSASTRRCHHLNELNREVGCLPETSPRRAEVENEIAVLRPIVRFEQQRFFRNCSPAEE